MKIDEIEISNFRSIKFAQMKDIGNMAVLIGPNSAGKSNFLEALEIFFLQLHPTPYSQLSALSDFLWNDRDTEKPIEIAVTLNLTKNEIKKILPDSYQQNYPPKEQNKMKIIRKIFGPENTPIIGTTLISVNEVPIYKKEKFPIPIPVVNNVLEPGIKQITPENDLIQNLSDNVGTQFKMIKAATNEFGLDLLGERNPVIPPEIMSELTVVGGSIDKKQIKKWHNFENNVRLTSNEISDVRIISDRVMVSEKNTDTRVPIHLVGGGNQEIMAISHQLSSDKKIFGIEEPERHLNPQLARKLLQFFKDMSSSKQLFIVTHSTIFVDQGELQHTWITSKDKDGTTIKRSHQPEDLKRMLVELGTKPSDIFYSNAILFVEGPTDKIFYSIVAKKLGIDLDSYGLGIVSIRGKGSGKYHLSVWMEAAKNIGIPFFMILDKDAKEESAALPELIIGENLFILEKGPLENYYPEEDLIDALKTNYEIELTPEEKTPLLGIDRVKEIASLLVNKNKDPYRWKFIVGEHVAEKIKVENIDRELYTIFEKIKTKLNRIS